MQASVLSSGPLDSWLPSNYDAWCCFRRGTSLRRSLPLWTTHTPVIQEIRVWWWGSDQERQPGLFLTRTPFLHLPTISHLQVPEPKACKPSSPSSLPPKVLPHPVHLTSKASLETYCPGRDHHWISPGLFQSSPAGLHSQLAQLQSIMHPVA